jgi:PBSX family phage terminase large subunit
MQDDPDSYNLKFTLHKYQEKIMNSDKRFLFAVAGVQSGKTMCGAIWLIREILKGWQEGKDYSYLIAAPTYKILQQSTLRKFFELMPHWMGEYKEQKSVVELKGGKGIIYVRSTEEAGGLEGMTLKAAWADECGQMNDGVWRTLQGRLAILQGRLIGTSTPYTFNWLFDLVSGREKRDDVEVVTWESIDNPWFPKEEYLLQKRLAEGDPAMTADFEKRYKGIFRRMSGRVYESWHEKYIIGMIDPNRYFKEYIGGIDWGYTQPSAVEVVGFADDVPTCTLVDEYYQTGKTIDEIAAICIAMMNKWHIRLFYADPSRPDYIQDLNTRRIPVIPAMNDIKQGVAVLQRLIKSGNLYVTRQCPHFLDEIDQYHYSETDDDVNETPVATKDHALDAVRYCIATHVPIEIIVTKEEKPIWKDIKESLKPEDEYEESMEAFNQDFGSDFVED